MYQPLLVSKELVWGGMPANASNAEPQSSHPLQVKGRAPDNRWIAFQLSASFGNVGNLGTQGGATAIGTTELDGQQLLVHCGG